MLDENTLATIRQNAKTAYNDDREAVAIELLAPYLHHNPDDSYAWYMYGDALRVVGRRIESEQALLRALELVPESKRAYVLCRLARLYDDMGRHTEAERYFLEVTSDPEWKDLGWLWIMRGTNLACLGEFRLAEKCHRKATELKEVDVDEAWLNIGLVLRAQAKYADAANALRKCLELDPSCAIAEKSLKSMSGIETAIADVGEKK